MKRMMKNLVLISVLALTLCVGVFAAAPSVDGIYNLSVTEGYTVTPDTKAASGEITIEGGVVENFFPNAVKLTVSYAESNVGNYHMVFALNDATGVPTEDNLVYIDQTSAKDGKVDFTVYPSELVDGVTYNVYAVGTELALTKIAEFTYCDIPSAASVNGESYETLSAALAAARTSGGTVKLMRDATETTVVVQPGVTLDLNGYDLTATNFVASFAGSNVIDSSAGNAGRLKCANPSFHKDNAALPLLGDDGYMLDDVSKFNHMGSASGGAFSYTFKPSLVAGSARIAENVAATGVEVKLVLSWNGGEKTLNYKEDMIEQVYGGKAFNATITGYESFLDKDLKLTVTISANKVILSGEPFAITG